MERIVGNMYWCVFGLYFLVALIWGYKKIFSETIVIGYIIGMAFGGVFIYFIPILPGVVVGEIFGEIFELIFELIGYNKIIGSTIGCIIYILSVIYLMIKSLIPKKNLPNQTTQKITEWYDTSRNTPIEEIAILPPIKREKAFILGRIEKIYITNATSKELQKKKGGFYRLINKKVRKRLVYHTNSECKYALKDYVVDGKLIALNSGVIASEYRQELALCDSCAKEVENKIQQELIKKREPQVYNYQPTYTAYRPTCSRCGGSGYLSQYSYVEGGRCFKCGGSGKA